MTKIFLRFGREKSLLSHHPWLFSGGIERVEGATESGEIVEVYSAKKQFLGRGFYNKGTSIAVRMFSFKDDKIDKDFWRKKIEQAVNFRKIILDFEKTTACRLVHGEADFLPGLIVDKYGDYLCLQVSTSGMEKIKQMIIDILVEVLKPNGIYERSDMVSRKVEGLAMTTGVVHGEVPDIIEIIENGLKFKVNLKTGQKTGFFLDQRDNRAQVGLLAKNKTVLNCFSFSGGFSIYAAKGGAKKTTSVDISAEAIELAKENFALNNLDPDKQEFIADDVFEVLRRFNKEGRKFDLIVLDPPAFAKNAAAVKTAARGYKDINMQAFKILNPNGFLITCSCSQHLEKMLFQKIVHDAAIDAGRDVQLLETRGQAADHPIALAHPEGDYLKCLICRVI